MKVLQVQDADIVDDTPAGNQCFIIERTVSWFLLAVIVFVCVAISWEFRTSMQLHNNFLRNEMLKENMLRDNHAFYKHNAPVWMP